LSRLPDTHTHFRLNLRQWIAIGAQMHLRLNLQSWLAGNLLRVPALLQLHRSLLLLLLLLLPQAFDSPSYPYLASLGVGKQAAAATGAPMQPCGTCVLMAAFCCCSHTFIIRLVSCLLEPLLQARGWGPDRAVHLFGGLSIRGSPLWKHTAAADGVCLSCCSKMHAAEYCVTMLCSILLHCVTTLHCVATLLLLLLL
jgi:hypothetical protein